MFKGNIAFTGEETARTLSKIIQDIKSVDPTFYAKIQKKPSGQYVLTVFDTDKNRLWKRLTWLKNKTILINQNTPLWVIRKNR